MTMIRRPKLFQVNSGTATINCNISQTNCSCDCPQCVGCCVDCADCPNLILTDIELWVYRAGDFITTSGNCIPNYLLMYVAFSWDTSTDQATFFVDGQLLALPAGRYEGEVKVKGMKAGLINFQLGHPYGICEVGTSTTIGGDNDMQPSGDGSSHTPVNS